MRAKAGREAQIILKQINIMRWQMAMKVLIFEMVFIAFFMPK